VFTSGWDQLIVLPRSAVRGTLAPSTQARRGMSGDVRGTRPEAKLAERRRGTPAAPEKKATRNQHGSTGGEVPSICETARQVRPAPYRAGVLYQEKTQRRATTFAR